MTRSQSHGGARKSARCLFSAALLAMAGLAPAQSSVAQEAAADTLAAGERLYKSRCFACHSLDRNRVGPRHRDVFGRRAGSVEGYGYSPALAQADFTWTEDALDRWLADPQALVPGQKMNFRVRDSADRARIIAYLKSLTPE